MRRLNRTLLLTLMLSTAGLLALWMTLGSQAEGTASADRLTIEKRASVFTDSEQSSSALAVDTEGRMTVVWDSRRQQAGTSGVYGRSFDAMGRPLSHEVRLNATVRGMQSRPAVAAHRNGSWIAWESHGQDGSGSGVVARRFGPDLGPLGPELPVNVLRDGDQAQPVIAATADGRALVAWSSPSGMADFDPARSVIRARRLSPDGEVTGDELAISREDGARDALPAVTALPDDRFLVVWARRGTAAGEPGIRGRFVDWSDGEASEEISITPTGADIDQHIEPAVDADREGRFVVAWLATDRDRESAGHDVMMRRFDADGTPLGAPRIVATADAGWNSGVAVAMAPDGRFAVSYNRYDADGEGHGIFAWLYDADGRPSEDAVRQVNRRFEGDQWATIASGARRSDWSGHDQLVFAWNGDAGDGDSKGANFTLWAPTDLAPAAPAVLGPALEAPAVDSESMLAAIPPIWNPDRQPQARLATLGGPGGDFGFEAIPGTGWTPPDPEVAIGPDHAVVMTNGAIGAFDLAGNLQWQDEIENSFGFWGELGADNFVFDPEVMWDPHSSRFFAMACERSDDSRSYFLLGVSKDSQPDDRNDWHKYRIDVTSMAGNDIDSPNLSTSSDFVLLTADFFGPDKYLILVIDKSSVLGGGAPLLSTELITGFSQQSMGIPVVYSDDATLYILQSTEQSTNTQVIFHAITDPITAYSRQTFTLAVPAYTYPNSPPQKGSSSRPFLFEPRFWSVAERNGSIWAVHHVNGSRARAAWYQFDLNGWPSTSAPSLTQSGQLNLGSSIHTFFPSIHVDALDNAAITFARSSPDEYISMGRAVRAADDPPNTFRPVQVVQVSANAHTSGRWGDYSGTQADPLVPGTFWGHHEFTNGAQTSWRSWVGQYVMRPEPLQLRVPRLVAGATSTLSVTGATPGETVTILRSAKRPALTELPVLSVVVSLDSPRTLASGIADGNGTFTFEWAIPPGMAGRRALFQAVEFGETSNWLKRAIR